MRDWQKCNRRVIARTSSYNNLQRMKESYHARCRRLAAERGRRMARARWRKEHAARDRGEVVREPRWEEIVARSKDDRRARVIAEGCGYSAASINPWQVRWSVEGRVDQLDLLFGERVVFTGSKRRLRALAPWLRLP